MSDPVINSAQSSSMMSVLKNTSTEQHPYKYAYSQDLDGASFSALSKSVQAVQSSQSKVFNSNLDFKVPRAGYWAQGWVKLTINKSATTAVNNSIGALLVERIQLLTAGKVLFDMPAEALLARVADMPYNTRKAYEDALLLGDGGDGSVNLSSTTQSIHYIPLLFSIFDGCERYLNTNFCEELTIRLQIGSDTGLSSDAIDSDVAEALSSYDAELFCEYHRVPADAENAQIQADFGDGMNLSTIQYNYFHEFTDKTLVASTATDTTHEWKGTNLYQKFLVKLDSGRGDVSNTIDNVGLGIALTNIKLECNGQTLMDAPAKLLQYVNNKDHFKDSNKAFECGSPWDTSSRVDGTENVYVINFGDSCDMKKVSGAIAARELHNFKLTVSSSAQSATQVAGRLHVVGISPFIMSVSAESGRISSSISS
jgi:hypothetical protein